MLRFRSHLHLTRTVRISVVALAILVLSSLTTFAASDERFIVAPDTPGGDVITAEAAATINVGQGSQARLFYLRNSNGQIASVQFGFMHAAGTSGIGDIPALRGANPLELFNALSKPGARIPAALTNLYGSPRLGHQGWARSKVLTGGGTQQLGCMPGAESFNSFDNDILAKGYAGVFLAEADGPTNRPEHWSTDPGPADGTNWYRLQGQALSAKAFYTKVQYCFADYNIYGNFEPDPVAHVQSRLAGFGAWSDMVYGFNAPGDELEYVSFPQTGANYDYRLQINLVRALDSFHIGATWSKPGYIKPNP